MRFSVTMACAAIFGFFLIGSAAATDNPPKPTCLVLADGYVSEYAWSVYEEGKSPPDHPGHEFFVRGLLGYRDRFSRWLDGWNVKRIDLERHQGPLPLDGVDLVILDDVRQVACESHEAELVEFVRAGGGLLVYAGKWGLGGGPKDPYSVVAEVSNFRNSPIEKILPVEIAEVPDWEALGSKSKENRHPVFRDVALGKGIDKVDWQILALHACKPRGEVLTGLDGRPLITRGRFENGSVVVYTGDDLGWVRQGIWSGPEASANINRFSGTLWKRLAALAIGDATPIEATPDASPTWQKSAAFAHPEQPMNFQWGGYFYYRFPEMMKFWAKDLVTHSANLYFGATEELGNAGVQGCESFGVPLNIPEAIKDPSTWMIGADGKPIEGAPCYNNPKALELMSDTLAKWGAEKKRSHPWATYAHIGDETQWRSCYCDHCRSAFRKQFGYELPPLKNDFSQSYLDQWIDYHLFKNASIGRTYALAGRSARKENPGLKVFASLPMSGGMCHGDDMFHTQSGFDLLWDHTYPGTMAISVGLSPALLEDTAQLQGRPSVPIFNLLQGFDSYDRVPNIPPPEYMRAMTWGAISHGVDSVGWFVYNAFFWNYPGTEAWDEAGRLGTDVLSPLTPTLYEMTNAPQPVGLLYSYSQEAVDGLKEQVYDKDHPWKSVIRWWSKHATEEAYEVLKYAHIPFNVISEHRILEGKDLSWKAIVIAYAEHLHPKTRSALQKYIADGGTVYIGANSTLDLPGIKKLPISFDTKFTTWWPKDKRAEWNQRRSRQYLIGPFLVKARQMSKVLSQYAADAVVSVDDPQVVYNVRQAGAAKYVFFINDHQINPVSADMRKKRQKYNHFMLMPMEFPAARTAARIPGAGYLYPLLSEGAPMMLRDDKPTTLDLSFDGGDGKVFLILPEEVAAVEFIDPPQRVNTGITLHARVRDRNGPINASIPLKIGLACGNAKQTAYATTKQGILSWTVPYLTDFPNETLAVTITDIASGKSAMSQITRK